MAYTKLIENISIAIEGQFMEISTRYNFDLGVEFEIGICELLSQILPEKYGVCRGFIVTGNDNFAGDDIIIYDKSRFPTLRLLTKDKFDKKQEIPIEAVYAYLEAKYTLHLLDTNSGQSLYKAISQVSNVKKLPRDKRSLLSIDPYTSLEKEFKAERINWPNYTNPIYGGIISRFVRDNSTSDQLSSENIPASLEKTKVPLDTLSPDLIILGQNDLMFAGISTEKEITYNSPFFIEGLSTLIHKTTNNSSLAVGIIMLLYALDTIKLNTMPYKRIIGAQLI